MSAAEERHSDNPAHLWSQHESRQPEGGHSPTATDGQINKTCSMRWTTTQPSKGTKPGHLLPRGQALNT